MNDSQNILNNISNFTSNLNKVINDLKKNNKFKNNNDLAQNLKEVKEKFDDSFNKELKKLEGKKNNDYKLMSVIYYYGNSDSGHYYCSCLEGDTWYKFNDSNVRKEINNERKGDDDDAIILIYGNETR